MYTDPISLNDSVPTAKTFVRTGISANGSTWVCDNPGTNYRQSIVIRHTPPSKPKGSAVPVYRSNIVLKLEKYNTTSELWDAETFSLTVTHTGPTGPLAAVDWTNGYTELLNFINATNMSRFQRQEV